MDTITNVYEKLEALNITLPHPPAKGGIYIPVQEFGQNLLYCSGCGPDIGDGKVITGKLGKDLSVEEGQLAARRCMLNLLANLNEKIGDLNRIKKFVKILGFVNSCDQFSEHPKVINGASQLLLDIFGEEIGLAARTAIGTNATPGNIACEIELLVELK